MADDNTIIIKASDYQYPTREELRALYKITPDLISFGFKSGHPFSNLISRQKSIREVHRDDHLHYWDGVLLNRNGALAHTYHNAAVHYFRGIPDDWKTFQHRHYINRMQFDYYAEVFYYHFGTVKDTIGQILNTYYQLDVPTEKLYFNESFLKKIPEALVIQAITDFFQATSKAREFRNSFTHRAPINYPDTRSTVQLEISQLTYGSASSNFVKSSEINENLDRTFRATAKLLETLKPRLPQDLS